MQQKKDDAKLTKEKRLLEKSQKDVAKKKNCRQRDKKLFDLQ